MARDGAVAATAVRATGAGLDAIDASHDMASHDGPGDVVASSSKEQNSICEAYDRPTRVLRVSRRPAGAPQVRV